MVFFRNCIPAAAIALAIFISSCGGGPIEHGTEYIIACDTHSDTTLMNATSLVIQKRLDNFGLEGDYELSHDADRITIRLRSVVDAGSPKMQKLISSANLTFRAMYNFDEISSAFEVANQKYLRIQHIDSLSADTEGFPKMAAFVGNPYGPMIFCCRAKDTSAVMNILRMDSIAVFFNSDVVFHWGTGTPLESGEPTYGLFACKDGFNYTMNGNSISSAVATMNSNRGSWEISLTFDPAGSKAFAHITKANIGRSLAIELDNFVYSYPVVNSEITGGMAVITGNFTQEEASDLAQLLRAGALPVRTYIVEKREF